MSVALALLSSVMWGVGDFLGGIAARRLHVIAIVGLSQSIGLVGVVAVGTSLHADWDWSALRWAVLASAGGATGLLTFYKALSIGRMGIVSPIAALGGLVPMTAGLIGGDRPSWLQGIGLGVAIIGVVFASGPELSGGADPKPVLLAFAAALGFGIALWAIAEGSAISLYSTTVIMRVCTISGMAIAALFVAEARGRRVENWWLIGAAGVLDVAANSTFGLAANGGVLALVSVLGSVYPVVTALLAWKLLHERLLRVQYLGVALTMLGIFGIVGG